MKNHTRIISRGKTILIHRPFRAYEKHGNPKIKSITFFMVAALVLGFPACGKVDSPSPIRVSVTGITITDARSVFLKGSTFNRNGIRVSARSDSVAVCKFGTV